MKVEQKPNQQKDEDGRLTVGPRVTAVEKAETNVRKEKNFGQ